MASTIKLKNGSGAPLAGDLVQGEPALDLTNKRLYTENASGTVIEVGTNPSSLTIGGTALTATAAELNTLDGITATTAELNTLDGITATTAELNTLDGITATVTELNVLDGITATTAELNYTDGVTSNIQTQLNAMVEKAGDSMTGNLSFGDNNKAVFGAGSDLQIYHDGSASRIQDTGTGDLIVSATDFSLRGYTANEAMINAVNNGAVTLYYDNSAKVATTATGINVTGTVTADGLTVDGVASVRGGTYQQYIAQSTITDSTTKYGGYTFANYLAAEENVAGLLGYADASVNRLLIGGGTGSLNAATEVKILTATNTTTTVGNERFKVASNGDISFYEDTGTTAKVIWDASEETFTVPQLTATTVASDNVDLSAISDSIADTAVDVFVYDTSKDSDGGAWRKRTQHTSWYNETLNTATRGSRREFPAVAVIVLTATSVKIYDGDDPSLPMWMVFIANSTGVMLHANGPQCISMLNGILAVGKEIQGLRAVDFLKDQGFGYKSAGGYRGSSGATIAERNDVFPAWDDTDSKYSIINSYINDVAMTVLPNAPIDQATGLPIPTIAVATDGGVSVITDSGAVYDITGQVQENTNISFTSDNKILTTGVYKDAIAIFDIPTADSTNGSSAAGAPNGYYLYSIIPPINGGATQDLVGIKNGFVKANQATSTGTRGLTIVDLKGYETQASDMVASINSTHNTGWMQGDIKGAWLSDTDDTDVTGTELITNGTFDSSSNWVLPTGFSIGSGVLSYDGTGSAFSYTVQVITTEVGKTYALTFDTTAISASLAFGAYLSTTLLKTISATGTTTVYFTATSTASNIIFKVQSDATKTFSIDNVSVVIADADRSVNANGLQVYGTITKTAVATGADLVAYSGFSGSNYLEQPYNSDLDFGTGDFYVMGWFKTSDVNTVDDFVLSRAYHNGSSWDGSALLLAVSTAGKLRFTISDDAFASSDIIISDNVVDNASWQCFAAVKDGSTLSLYINGTKAATDVTITSALASLDNSSASLILGDYHNPSKKPFSNGSLALIRMGVGAPSAEQVAKIYEDEKVLFQDGAQATLYGSSDAVTALAYDEDTNLLHVGTSAGRSVFQGLKRVDNTTTAVGAAISASNGLVAEE